MKKITLSVVLTLFTLIAFSQDKTEAQVLDSIEKTFTYEHGVIPLKGGIGKINIPQGFKYLNIAQAEHVLVDLWGNPKEQSQTLGLILPENQGVLSDNGYVFNVQYDEIGYVKDDDADDIDYADLLTQMREEAEEENKSRKKEGYEPIAIIGWAAQPFYDKERKILHWAKEFKFGNNKINTLNYNVRILGRKGVLILNAISTMPELPLVKKDIPKVLNIVQFNDGYKYKEFDSSIDEVAAWTIGGLVAGKILTKFGLFAIIAKFGKIIALSVLGFFGAFKNKIKGWFSKNKEGEEEEKTEEVLALESPEEETKEETKEEE